MSTNFSASIANCVVQAQVTIRPMSCPTNRWGRAIIEAVPTRETRSDDPRLTEWMYMPAGAGTRLEGDACAIDTSRFARLERRINANCASKI